MSLLIDAPHVRPPQRPPFRFTPEDVEHFVQTVVDLRRGVDLLLERGDINRRRLGFVGWSFGSVVAGILAGVEHRLRAYALLSGGGSESRFLRRTLASHPQAGPVVAAGKLDPYLAAMRRVDPELYVSHAFPAALLLQNGSADANVPLVEVLALFEASSDPKLLRWYDAGHELSDAARRDRLEWLSEQLLLSS